MILSHHGEMEYGSPKVPLFLEAMLLHHLDNLDSKMECMRGMVARDVRVEGCWTGYSAALDRSVLKKTKFLEEADIPDGNRLFLSVGSGSNVAQDMFPEPHWTMNPEPRIVNGLTEWVKTKPLGAAWDTEELRADVLSFDPNGKNQKIFATGLRNCEGMTVQPVTGQLWCIVNERDELGDNTPFEFATHVVEGAFYGWPWYFIGGHEDPRHAGSRPDLKDKVTVPDVLMQAHSAPLQMVFYERDNFPAEYKGTAFATMHGSWNRDKRTGYKVVRLLFDGNGKPTGEYEDFMTGFVVSDTQVWGRPVGVAVANDGSLFVTEDGNGTIWRITYQGSARSR